MEAVYACCPLRFTQFALSCLRSTACFTVPRMTTLHNGEAAVRSRLLFGIAGLVPQLHSRSDQRGRQYPPRIPDNTGRVYSETSPPGCNGREYFAKMAVGY